MPVSVIELIDSEALPLLVSVTDWAALVVLIVWLPKFSAVVESETAGSIGVPPLDEEPPPPPPQALSAKRPETKNHRDKRLMRALLTAATDADRHQPVPRRG